MVLEFEPILDVERVSETLFREGMCGSELPDGKANYTLSRQAPRSVAEASEHLWNERQFTIFFAC